MLSSQTRSRCGCHNKHSDVMLSARRTRDKWQKIRAQLVTKIETRKLFAFIYSTRRFCSNEFTRTCRVYAASLFFAENKFRPLLCVCTPIKGWVYTVGHLDRTKIFNFMKIFLVFFWCRLNILIPMALHFASLFAGHYCGMLHTTHTESKAAYSYGLFAKCARGLEIYSACGHGMGALLA